ncbi:glycoside hydrolase family 2 TIM barrel-domain containing protein [Streptomyces sp. TS71-3]|uniref:glycoside hydrolase family 2 TIM barrel-domain containing protein n=1 Tax=Streptomyces sp. TS71-3 TaxID=2733862 RepID=UPI001BB3702F|nr:glycoside hydrolase family 2 TIM barrel-domain containing protein [Streptomyces sp. TS71-3]
MTRRQALRMSAAAGATAGIAAGGSAVLAATPATAAAPADSEAHPAPLPAGARRERSFDEGWRFFRGDADGAEQPSFDDASWRALDLPHDWSIEDLPYATSDDGAATSDPSLLVRKDPGPGTPDTPQVIGPFDTRGSAGGGSTGYTVGGVGWYRKTFGSPDPLGGAAGPAAGETRAELRFDGVYQNADVWLNGVHLGFHPYGYTSFAYDLTPHLNQTGPNVLAVRVDNSGQNSRWYAGSGIYRHTWLTVTGPVRIPLWGVSVTTPVVGEQHAVARVDVSVAGLAASSTGARIRVTVLDPRGRAVGSRTAPVPAAGADGTVVASVDVPVGHPALWSPDSPNLCTAQAEVLLRGRAVDTARTRFGFRSLAWDGTEGFLLNGERITMRGGCVHHDHGPMGSVALDRSEERRVEILKAAGFNAIRTAHNPPTPALLDACDRLGMLVMDEFVDMWDTGKNPQDYSVHFAQWWQRDLTAMALRDRNHPSVVIWSLGNEITDRTGGQRGAEMAALLRTLDRTRPITLGGGSTPGAGDPSWDYVDIGDVHYNANGQGYGGIHDVHPEKPMAQSEGFPATVWEDETFVGEHAFAVGNWVWAAWDYLGESGLGKTPVADAGTATTIGDPSVNPGWGIARTLYRAYGGYGYPYPFFQANCGDVDLIGQRKPQSHWRAAVLGLSPVEMLVQRPVPEGAEQLAVWWGYYDELESWTWDVPSGRPMTVHVYTAGDSVRLQLNGAEFAGGAARAPERGTAAFTVPYAAGELTAVAGRNGREIGRTTLRTVGAPAALRLTPDVRALTTGRDDLAHVLVTVVDSRGRAVPDAVVKVSFLVDGAGELAAAGNGNPHNVDSFRRPRRHTWHGKALAILRPGKRPGVLRLTASAPGLRPATVALPVGPAGGTT